MKSYKPESYSMKVAPFGPNWPPLAPAGNRRMGQSNANAGCCWWTSKCRTSGVLP